MGRKNPWVAAILNFFLPGIGFIYCGTTLFIVGGAILFILSLIATAMTIFERSTIEGLIISFGGAFLWAILGYVAAKCVNKKRMPPPIPPPPAAPVALPSPTPMPSEKVYCVYCGAENPVDAFFCRKCGKKIVKPA